MRKGGVTMSENENRTKPKYEAPVIVALGGLAMGSGECRAGSGASEGDCTAGTVAASYCTDGSATGTACTAGGAAPAACTAGSTDK
jgi:hypothetical protein